MMRRPMCHPERCLRLVLAALLTCACGGASWAIAMPRPPLDRDPLILDRDTTVSPAVDFFQYANGGWLKAHPIPPTERGWGIGNVVREGVYSQLIGICAAAARSGARPGTNEQKLGDFWAAGMDSDRIDSLGAAPLQPFLGQIAAIQTRDQLIDALARFRVVGFRPLFSLYVGQDERNSDRYLVHVRQGGFRLPDRDYYFGQDSSTTRVRNAYAEHLSAMFRLLGEDDETALRSSATVLRFESTLAGRSRTLEQRRDPWANYNKFSLADFSARTPALNWQRQFSAMGIPRVDTLIVEQPEFFALADSCVANVPLEDWRTYLRWCVASNLSGSLSRPFNAESFRFFGTVMTGAQVQRPRWKRVMDAEQSGLGELLGQVWVARYVSPATKARYEKLTDDILQVYRDRIRNLAWMTDATRKRALAKLDRVVRKVAYPDHWRDFSALRIDRGSFAADQMNLNEWSFREQAARLGKPIDRTLWDITPQTYNAYYDGSKVEIVLPAAEFLIPGLPDSLVDDAILYSYAGGSTIGHEITHGFDDEGRQFDEHGNLNPWWTDADSVQFTRRARMLVEEFNQFRVGDKQVRGQATLGENLADLGGVRLGYEAFKKTEQWKKGEMVNGLTPDQRYFLGYALSWLSERRPQSVAQLIMSDVHAPEQFRVNGPVANFPEFYQAFGVKPGDPMWRAEDRRVEIW